MKVNIYTYASLSPKKKPRGYGYILECEREGKEPVTLSKIGILDGTSQETSALAVLEALRRLSKQAILEIHTESPYAFEVLARLLAQWKQADFKNSKNEDVANKDIWMEISEILEGYEYKVYCRREHQYKNWLIDQCKRKETENV